MIRRLGKRSVERVRYEINNLLHLVIVKYGVISLVLCISTHLRLVTILSQLVKYLVLSHICRSNSHGLKMIFPGNFLSGIVYFPVISPPAVFISLLFSLTTAAVVSSYYIMTKW